MPIGEEIIPLELNLDLSAHHLDNRKARFIRNMDLTEFAGEQEGKTAMVWKPLQANYRVDPTFSLPPGKNRVIGTIERSNIELFVFVWNSLENHSIYRVRNGKCEFVYVGKELRFRNKSRYFVTEHRAVIIPVRVGEDEKTFIAWLNGFNEQCFLCAEDSIATGFFDANKFARFGGSYNKAEIIALGLREPEGCISVTPVTNTNPTGINKLRKNAWQFRLSYTDAYGRPSEHGSISDLYYQNDCASGNTHCVDLSFDAGGPLVEQWHIEFRRGCKGDWSRAATLDKYENCEKPWYERQINKKLTYDATTNKLTFRFCADEECVLIPPSQTRRAYNPMPITSECLFFMAGSLGLGGNKYGQKPFACELLDKVKLSVERPDIVQKAVETRNVTVWVRIYNPYNNMTQGIYKNPSGGRIVWGGVGPNGRQEEGVQDDYGQYFADPSQEGFIGSLGGYAAISKQYRYEDTGDLILDDMHADEGKLKPHGVAKDRNEIRQYSWMQKFEFKNVRPGKYIFRIHSHQSRLEDKNYQFTSTYTAGQAQIVNGRMSREKGNEHRELVVDVCEKDYNTMQDVHYLQIWDLTEPHQDINLRREIKVLAGYVWEAMDADNGIIPIEAATIRTTANSSVRMVNYTDHNGFYFVAFKDNDSVYSNVVVRRKCTQEELGRNRMETTSWLSDRDTWGSMFTSENKGVYFKNFVAKEKWPDFLKEKCNRTIIRGKVVECGTGNGVAGVLVSLTTGGTAVTNSKGEYSLIVHDYEFGNRTERLFFSPSTSCAILNCENGVCLPQRTFRQEFCTDSSNCNERVSVMEDVQVKFANESNRGPQLGGRYAFALKGADWMGRTGFAQTKPEYYLDIPTTNELGGFGYPRIKWEIPADARFPRWMTRLYFNWSKNLKYSDMLEWVVDRFEFVDNTGNINEVTPSQIRIYYNSLGEYNKQHNFATNSTWQFIGEDDSLRTTDTVHFVANGDGKIFPEVITEQVRFDRDGRYFTVDFNEKLRDLKDGAKIKLIRQQECQEAVEFNELCDSIRIVDGVPEKTSGYLNVFDSYYLGRSIPTPVVETIKRTVTTINNGTFVTEEVTDSLTKNVLKNYGWPFEHHSPSDKWGDKCANRGRPSVKNERENEFVREDEIALSGSVGTNSLVNYLHYFDNETKKEFKLKKGMMVAGLVRSKGILVVLEEQSHVVAYDDSTIRTGRDGVARTNSGEQQFGDPQNESSFGCRLEDRGTISFKPMMGAKWVDSGNVAYVYHDFEKATDISRDKFESFLRRKIKSLQSNKDGTRYFHQGYNPKDAQCYLTDFNQATEHYINDTYSPQIDANETLCVDAATLTLRKFASFTPEWYAGLAGEDEDKQFFMFKEGYPYAHYRQNPVLFNNFFGVQCQRSIRIATGIDPLRVKRFLSLETYVDKVQLYSPEVLTESGQRSEIPRNFFGRAERFWFASFLCDLNTPPDPNLLPTQTNNILTEGNTLRGRWIEVLLVGDPDNLEKYSELTGIILFVNGVEKTGK